MDQFVDISTDGLHLSLERGFLKVSLEDVELGRTPLDRIVGVIVHAHGTTWSAFLLTELGERGVPVVLCGSDHAPRSVLQSLQGNHAQGTRVRAQWRAKTPMLKQAWKLIVTAKIKMQAAALESMDQPSARLHFIARSIASGDSRNTEAQAARYYWPLMMGKQFRRNVDGSDVNSLLNFGYTVLRAAAARALVAVGLHPSIGLHHSNRRNAFALADDLVEPFRPLVDCAARNLVRSQGPELNHETKKSLSRLITTDLPFGECLTPVSGALIRLASSLGQSFESGRLKLEFPNHPDAKTLANLGQGTSRHFAGTSHSVDSGHF